MNVCVIGAGLAGCEAAYAAANNGADVVLYEMKPKKFSPAHHNSNFCELVCSNSLKSKEISTASGLLKREMEFFNSVVLECAYETAVPAGGALAVDRELFAEAVTNKILSTPNITFVNEEVFELPDADKVIIACGPLVDAESNLYKIIKDLTGEHHSFFDAAAPILTADSIDMSKAFYQARYNKGGDDYINCPMTKDEYTAFYKELVSAERAVLHNGVESPKVFEGCMPVEILAKRGEDSIRFGPLKPVGITCPDGSKPYAVVQLRQDNKEGTLFNIVGFQTNLKFSEQKRVFSMIPGLENAEFVRYGVMHRNLYIDAPNLMNSDFSLKNNPDIYFAGQISGVEGYLESAMSGMIAGYSASGHRLKLSQYTMMGAISNYISGGSTGNFQPMPANFGIVPPLDIRVKNKKERYTAYSERSLKFLSKKN